MICWTWLTWSKPARFQLPHNKAIGTQCRASIWMQIISSANQWKTKPSRDDQCLQKTKNGWQDEALCTQVRTSSIRQQVFGKIQGMHHREQNDSQVCPSWLPPLLQHHRMGNPKVQKPFCLHPNRVDDRFPLSLWCHLMWTAKLTVNLLQQSNVAPKVSMYAHVYGHQHCNTLCERLLQNPPVHVRAPASRDNCTGILDKQAEGAWLQSEQNNTWAKDTWVVSDHLFSCHWWLWGKKHWRRTHSAPDTNDVKIFYMLVWKERRKILQTHHQVGLFWKDGAPFGAIVRWEGFEAVPASSTYRTAGSATPTHQKHVRRKSPTC